MAHINDGMAAQRYDVSLNSSRLHMVLKRHAIRVDSERLERTIPRVNEIVKKGKRKAPGFAVKILLQEMDRVIDDRFAETLESELRSL